MSPLLIIAVLCLLLLYVYQFAKSRPPNFPPGPTRIPVFGNYLQLLATNYRYPYRQFHELTRKYKSKVLGLFYGSIPAIIICDYEGIKEASSQPELQGRFNDIVTRSRAFGKDLGIFFVDGPLWEEQRRFSLRHMRDFGFGCRSEKLEAVIQEEISHIIDLLNGCKKDEEVFRDGLALMPVLFYTGSINIFLSLMMNERLTDQENRAMRKVAEAGRSFVRALDTAGGFLAQMPWLRHIYPRVTGLQESVVANDTLLNFLKRMVRVQNNSYCEDHTRSFIDVYNNKIKHQEANEKPATFCEEQQMIMALDYFLPVNGTLPSVITFTLIMLLHYPEVQKKVQEEIDAVVGRGRLPTLNDRPSMPYTEATLRESMRRNTAAPMSVAHRSMKDTTFRGYNVPENTMVLLCLGVYHMDEDVWGDPKVFRPERFLDDNGLLKKKDISLPFGSGKRLCVGETFVRQTIFLMFASLMQNFTMCVPEGQLPPALDSFAPGLVETTDDIWLKIVPRDY